MSTLFTPAPHKLSWSFTVYGTPIPQGSTRAFIPKGWKRPVITAANSKTKPWRQEIVGVAFDCLPDVIRRPTAVRLTLVFTLSKPKSVPNRILWPSKKPDIDKLERAVLDALAGIAYEDDAQVCELTATKVYGSPEMLQVTIGVI